MANNVLVPGTLATRLVDSDGVVVHNAVKLNMPWISPSSVFGGRPKEEWVDLLSMAHADGVLAPQETSLEPGTEVLPGRVVELPYQRIADQLLFDFFRFDWRADIRWNAENFITYLQNRTAGGKHNLVGHSQGGLIIVLASKLFPAEFGRLVQRVVLVGVPLAGTVEAARGLIWGRDSFGDRVKARAMARTWPALYQMLPAWPCLISDPGFPGGAHPLPEDNQLLERAGWLGHEDDISNDMLERARATQALLKDPLGQMASVLGGKAKIMLCQGLGSDTHKNILVKDRRFSLHNIQQVDGDSLVPDQLTVDFSGHPDRFLRLSGVPKHKTLLDSEEFIDRIGRFLR